MSINLDASSINAIERLRAMRDDVLGGRHLSGEATHPTPDEIEHDLGILVRMMAARAQVRDVKTVRIVIAYDCDEEIAQH